jgi:hypothetical protein
MRKVSSCRKTCLLVLIILNYCRHRHRQALFSNDVAACTTWHNDQFIVKAAAPMAPTMTRMLIITSPEGYLQLPCTKPYIFLRRSHPTTTPQCSSMRCDLNGQQRPPWCPTPNADAENSHPECWRIVICSGARSGVPWQPWEDSGHHGCVGHGLSRFS